MRITGVKTQVDDLDQARTFYGDVLQLPVEDGDDAVSVRLGRTTLTLLDDERRTGCDHVAFNIASDALPAARRWLASRGVDLLGRAGETEFPGPPAWRSRSVYFSGPSGAVLELIARSDLPAAGEAGFDAAGLTSVSEVGIAVTDVAGAVASLATVGSSVYAATLSDDFAAVGDEHGLLILAHPGRAWLPTTDRRATAAPLDVTVTSDQPWSVEVGGARITGVPGQGTTTRDG